MNKGFINFASGMILGAIAFPMWQYSKFLYYTVFSVQVIIIYILINFDYKVKK